MRWLSRSTSRSRTTGARPNVRAPATPGAPPRRPPLSSSVSGAPVPQPWKRSRFTASASARLGGDLRLAGFADAGRDAVDRPSRRRAVARGCARLASRRRAVLRIGAQLCARPPRRDVADLLEAHRPGPELPPTELPSDSRRHRPVVVEVEPVVGRRAAVVFEPRRRSSVRSRACAASRAPRGSSMRSANGSQ